VFLDFRIRSAQLDFFQWNISLNVSFSDILEKCIFYFKAAYRV